MIKEYLKFLLKSSNEHGVHSPFIFDLVTKCFYKKNITLKWNDFLDKKQQLLDNKNYIKVTDFGSGSKVFTTNNRQIAKITKVAGISNIKAKILIKIIHYFKPKNILEIGTSVGLGTSALKIGNLNSEIITLEGCPETAKVASDLFLNNGFKNIEVIVGDFKQTIPKVLKNNSFNCIYFDGNHTKKATLTYFNYCLSAIKNDSFWIFDDIYWSSEMKEAWFEIKKHPRITVSVDVFHFGIVFFRKEQAKEHFKIRV
ncbi:O-methyltransferase [Polaribacter septentrionalilitoris]|uniref:O-methyltransferase n=1 Tax=Polaribacter septentrionalilitoris TaxID=2494657 RepID=UPI00135C9529|nr:class I SAM-dependent methyltransferase [Polaribacter septentrionalilitoris]